MPNKWLLFIPILIVYLIGMFIDVMEADAAQYAAMGLEMLKTGNYLEIYYRGLDYIDKPPLIFWSTAISFKLFGPSNFSYRLPSVLFTLLGLYATYRLGARLYREQAGFYAALMLASCQAWFMFNHDVRTDTILAACTVFGIWQLVEFSSGGRTIHVFLAAFGIAGAMLTKGPIGIMVPALALGTDYILKRKWHMLFRWQWLLLVAIVLGCLLPMLYGLYMQFDAHGGKDTFNYGRIDSGLYFYFWTQSFGRLTGESAWRNETDPFFFAHTFLWAFLPWCLLFIPPFIRRLKTIVRRKLSIGYRSEAVTIGGTLLPAIAFSLSSYKLPHYIFVLFPLVAILSGDYVEQVTRLGLKHMTCKILAGIQSFIAALLVVLTVLISVVWFPVEDWVIGVAGAACICFTAYSFFRRSSAFWALLIPSFAAILALNFMLNAHFYPHLLTYQVGSVAGRMSRSASESRPLAAFRLAYYSLDFYSRKSVPIFHDVSTLKKAFGGQSIWVLSNEEGYHELLAAGVKARRLERIEHFHVSMLNEKFLNPKTRAQALSTKLMFVAEIPY